MRAAAHAGYLERGRIVRKLEWATRSSAPAKRLQVYVGPRDTPVLYAGTEVIELSPTEEFGRTMEVVTNNMEETQASS